MVKFVGAWAFFLFIYFKIFFDAAFYEDISIVASLLISIVFGFSIYFLSEVYEVRLLKFYDFSNQKPVKIRQLVKETLWPFLGMCVGSIVVSRLILFGFSKKLSHDIDLFDRDWGVDESFIYFTFIILVPFLIHYSMNIFPTYKETKR
ncbi:MAG: hypothetical protein IH901_03630 [Proteobacteria bacterium]|nr:hypothetical protein [Pseudomonadota bacterium]